MKYYSKTTSGFYHSEIHGDNIPVDAVEVTDEEYLKFFEEQETRQPSEADKEATRHLEIMEQLRDIDRKSIRAISDYILTGSSTKLRALQDHAEALRKQLIKG